jgi:hypothetical protein
MTSLLSAWFLCVSFCVQPTGVREQISRKWLMIGVEMNGKKYGEEWLERQRQNGLASVLEFQKSGACQVHVYTKGPQGRTQKKTTLNKWKLSEDEKQLTILTDGAPPQIFTIMKVSSKRLTLQMQVEKETQVFTYKAVKD